MLGSYQEANSSVDMNRMQSGLDVAVVLVWVWV